jgi:DNA adenine methylase
MMDKFFNRSPLFYMGDKYKLLPEITPHFPADINRFIEPFTGGGSVFLNVDAKEYLLNDLDQEIMALHKFLRDSSKDPKKFFQRLKRILRQYELSRSFLEDVVPHSLKKEHVKTYYAKFNKPGYLKLRSNFNTSKPRDYLKLYILLIYGFNRILRFNQNGEFNLPVGNVDFNKNTEYALKDYFSIIQSKKIKLHTKDFKDFLDSINYQKDDFVYLDPPYLITFGEYNKYWNEESEEDLLRLLDELNNKKVKWALSNVVEYTKETKMINKQLKSWMTKYQVQKINSNYISFRNNKQKIIKEVLVRNFFK